MVRNVYWYLLLLLLFSFSCQEKGKEKRGSDIYQPDSTKYAPINLQLTHIEIGQQFIDYRQLAKDSYRNTFPFGNALYHAFDSVAQFNNYPVNLTLPNEVNHLAFHFSAIDWTAPHKIQYSYLMEGLEDSWSLSQNDPIFDFRDLPYGTFTLNVRGIGESQVWSNPFQYTFTILPPWWHTWWAYIFYLVTSIVFAYGIYWLRMRYINKLGSKEDNCDSKIEEIPPFLQKINQQLETNLDDSKFGVEQLSESLAIDSSGMYRKIKALTNTSPSQYIRSFRLAKAKELLLDHSLNISEVAYRVGYSDPNYFSKVFKKETGLSPTEFKAENIT